MNSKPLSTERPIAGAPTSNAYQLLTPGDLRLIMTNAANVDVALLGLGFERQAPMGGLTRAAYQWTSPENPRLFMRAELSSDGSASLHNGLGNGDVRIWFGIDRKGGIQSEVLYSASTGKALSVAGAETRTQAQAGQPVSGGSATARSKDVYIPASRHSPTLGSIKASARPRSVFDLGRAVDGLPVGNVFFAALSAGAHAAMRDH